MRDRPLSIAIEGDELVIRIGIGTLAHAARHCPVLAIDGVEVVVADVERLGRDVIRELQREDEDGTTPVHSLLDTAILVAWEQGSAAFKDDDDEDEDVKGGA